MTAARMLIGAALCVGLFAGSAQAQEPVVRRATVSDVELRSSQATRVSLLGSGFMGVVGAEVREWDGTVVDALEVSVLRRSSTRLDLQLRASEDPVGSTKGRVFLLTRRRAVEAPVDVVLLGAPSARFRSLTIGTPSLSMTGLRFTSPTISTAGLSFTGERFRSLTVSPGALGMTGVRFRPLTLRTDDLAMKAVRFRSLSLPTDGLVMTGVRFQSLSIQTAGLGMTGETGGTR